MKNINPDSAKLTGQELQSDFLPEPELLRRVPASRRTLFNWRTAGKIPYLKLGRRVMYHWPSVEAALLRQQRGCEK
jgi:hypothetical protein